MDAMRCILAVAVAFAHGWYLLIEDYGERVSLFASAGYFLAGFAHASVILFFVLSGYWIASSVNRRLEQGWRWSNYLVDRLSRLLIVLVPTLVIGGTLDALGLYVLESTTHAGATDTYVLRTDVDTALGWQTLIGNLLFLQDIIVRPYGTNGPLWSLAYEFWFYIWFPALLVSVRARRPSLFLLTLGLAFAAPGLLVGFACWLSGALLFWVTSTNGCGDSSRLRGRAWLAATCAALAAMLVFVRMTGLVGKEVPLAVTFAGFLFVLLNTEISVPRSLKLLASYGAKASFSLYALHFPLLAMAAALMIDGQRLVPSAANIGLLVATLVGVIAICGVFARHTERHTCRVRAFFANAFHIRRARRTE
jgi:peptidoglycan/LPS O-acetylase OafA/YrhL